MRTNPGVPLIRSFNEDCWGVGGLTRSLHVAGVRREGTSV